MDVSAALTEKEKRMAKFKVVTQKGASGEILVYGHYISGNEPVFVERVDIAQMDSKGNTVFASTHHINKSIDPGVQGVYLLVSKKPAGINIKSAKASAYYIEIEETAESETLTL
jgi:hypothetical protein